MKIKIIRAAIAAGLAILLLLALPIQAQAKTTKLKTVSGDPLEEIVKIRCTLYCNHGKTVTGALTQYGIVAGKKEWLGYEAEISAVSKDGTIGELIGIFNFQDTGAGIDTDGDGKGDSLTNGQSIDVWVASEDDVKEWQKTYGDYVYMRIRGELMGTQIVQQDHERTYEFFTCSGRRIIVKGYNMLTFMDQGDIFILDKTGNQVAQFVIANIEGWRIIE